MRLRKNIKFSNDLELLKTIPSNSLNYVNYFGNISAGFPSPADDFLQERISLDDRYLNKPENTFLTRVGGLSMFPEYQIGDVTINRSDYDLQHNEDAIVSINNSEFTLKRYNAEKKMLYAINDDFKDSFIVKENDVVVLLGIVVTIIRERKKRLK